MNITIIIDQLTEVANEQAELARNTDNPIELREAAATHYGTLVLILGALTKSRNVMIERELDRMQDLLNEGVPKGGKATIHPSMQPGPPNLRVVKGDDDDQDDR